MAQGKEEQQPSEGVQQPRKGGRQLRSREKRGCDTLHQQTKVGRTLHQHKDASNQQEETRIQAAEFYTNNIPKPQGGRTLKIQEQVHHQTKDQTEVAATNQTKR
jgi:hypothetical protein